MTLLFHVDESADDAHHFHAGLLSDGPGLAAVEAELNKIVDDASGRDVCKRRAELHAVEIFHHTGDWANATISDTIAVFDGALGLLSANKVEVIARGADLPRFRSKYGKDSHPYAWEFSNLLERLNERLKSRQEHGLVIADEHSEYKDILQRNLADARLYGTGGYRNQKLVRILDAAHFVDSRHSRMTQLADMVAFVLRRRAGRQPEHDKRLEAVMAHWTELIFQAVPEPTGQFHTIRY